MGEPAVLLLIGPPALRAALRVVAGASVSWRNELGAWLLCGSVTTLAWVAGMGWFAFERAVLKPWNWTAAPAVMVGGVLLLLPVAAWTAEIRMPWWAHLAVWGLFLCFAAAGVVVYGWCWERFAAG